MDPQKKKLLFIGGGALILVIIIVVVILLASGGGSPKSWQDMTEQEMMNQLNKELDNYTNQLNDLFGF